jgi:hypothetical protein
MYSSPPNKFPADCRRTAVRGGQIEGGQLIAVGEAMFGPIGGPELGVGAPHIAAGGLGLAVLCCGIAHTLDVHPGDGDQAKLIQLISRVAVSACG